LSGSKVVRGMVFGTESECAFPVIHLHANTKPTLIQPFPPHAGTTKHATAAKLAVFTCALDFVQTRSETERMALIKDETSGEERLAKVWLPPHLSPSFLIFLTKRLTES